MGALLLGGLLALGGLGWVLVPLLRGERTGASGFRADPSASEPTALDALREIEFDEATGKLSAEDYAALRAEYTPRAVEELRAQDAALAAALAASRAAESATAPSATSPGAALADDPAERLIARAKSRASACPQCGSRPEPDALFCSDCGRYLAAACLRCGAPVTAEQARFCTECGESLAA